MNVISYGTFMDYRSKRLALLAKRTPHQLAQQTMLTQQGWTVVKMSPSRELVMSKQVGNELQFLGITPAGIVLSMGSTKLKED
jgi:hypothetical protein